MKHIKYISVIITAFLVIDLSSCKKLDEFNPSGSTAEAVWTTPEGFVTAVNAAYADQRNFYGKEDGILMTEGGTDIWFNANKANFANQLTRYEAFTSASSGTSRNSFTTFYKGLNLCNAGIGRINGVPFASVDERNRREGELRFMRAFYLWHIVEFYGGVNLPTTETQGVVVTATRSSVEEFYNVIIEDLELAEQYLPNDWGNEYSRATKKSALGLLARAYLSRAYYSTGADATNYFTKARDAAKEVIDRKAEFKVELWPVYADLWLPANNKRMGKAGGESLYTISNSAVNTASNFDGNANRMHMWYLTQYSNKIGGLIQSLPYGNDNQRRLMPTLSLLDFFEEDKDARYEGAFQEVWIANRDYTWTAADIATYKKDPSLTGRKMTSGVDTALYITKKRITDESIRPYPVFDRDTTYFASSTRAINGSNNFVALKKFAEPNRTTPNAQPGYNDIFIIRFAEMYMIAAEAELQLGNKSQSAVYLNVIRTRAAKRTPVDQTAAMQVSANDITLDLLLDERAREFAGEHMRWFDLKRTRKLVDRVNRFNPDISAIRDYHVLRPVPQEELDALENGVEFGQNTGY
jgi:hypothetical protein